MQLPEDKFVPYQTDIQELPQEHSVDWRQFLPLEATDTLSWGQASALVDFLAKLIPAWAMLVIRWGAESSDGNAWIKHSEIRRLVGPQQPLLYKADLWSPVLGTGNRINLAKAWRVLYSSPIEDPLGRMCKVIEHIIGQNPKTGQAWFTEDEIRSKIGFARDIVNDEAYRRLAELSKEAQRQNQS